MDLKWVRERLAATERRLSEAYEKQRLAYEVVSALTSSDKPTKDAERMAELADRMVDEWSVLRREYEILLAEMTRRPLDGTKHD